MGGEVWLAYDSVSIYQEKCDLFKLTNPVEMTASPPNFQAEDKADAAAAEAKYQTTPGHRLVPMLYSQEM